MVEKLTALLQHEDAIPDWRLYYTISLTLFVALIIIVWRYSDRISKTLTEVKKTLASVEKMIAVHEVQIKNIESDQTDMRQDIAELRSKRRGQ